jgi:hypothetical protein
MMSAELLPVEKFYDGSDEYVWFHNRWYMPIPVAALFKARTVSDRSNIGIMGSNPARGMDVCPCFSVLCCPV